MEIQIFIRKKSTHMGDSLDDEIGIVIEGGPSFKITKFKKETERLRVEEEQSLLNRHTTMVIIEAAADMNAPISVFSKKLHNYLINLFLRKNFLWLRRSMAVFFATTLRKALALS